jgi:hypothetical protein
MRHLSLLFAARGETFIKVLHKSRRLTAKKNFQLQKNIVPVINPAGLKANDKRTDPGTHSGQ